MSTNAPQSNQAQTPAPASAPLPSIIGGYIVPTLTIVGIFVLIALGKLDANTGIPLVAAIAGVHGGAAVTSAATRT